MDAVNSRPATCGILSVPEKVARYWRAYEPDIVAVRA
jgi:hypothetical protein